MSKWLEREKQTDGRRAGAHCAESSHTSPPDDTRENTGLQDAGTGFVRRPEGGRVGVNGGRDPSFEPPEHGLVGVAPSDHNTSVAETTE
jgi:hypothetical protein